MNHIEKHDKMLCDIDNAFAQVKELQAELDELVQLKGRGFYKDDMDRRINLLEALIEEQQSKGEEIIVTHKSGREILNSVGRMNGTVLASTLKSKEIQFSGQPFLLSDIAKVCVVNTTPRDGKVGATAGSISVTGTTGTGMFRGRKFTAMEFIDEQYAKQGEAKKLYYNLTPYCHTIGFGVVQEGGRAMTIFDELATKAKSELDGNRDRDVKTRLEIGRTADMLIGVDRALRDIWSNRYEQVMQNVMQNVMQDTKEIE